MKKSIFISGIVSANLMMLGCLFKVMHWPGASIILVLAVALFCFVFLPFALMSGYREPDQQKYKWLYLVTFIVFFIGMMGTLFKVMYWPGASILLFLGIPMPFLLFLPVYLYQTRNEKRNGSVNFLGIMFGLTFLAVFSVLLALSVSKGLLQVISKNISSNEYSASYNNEKSRKYDRKFEINKSSDELCRYIDDLKCELLTATQNTCEANLDRENRLLYNIENADIPRQVLEGGEINKVMELKNKMSNYRKILLGWDEINQELAELSNELFNVDDRKNPNTGEVVSWEQQELMNYQLIFVLDELSEIQSNARLVEAECLSIK